MKSPILLSTAIALLFNIVLANDDDPFTGTRTIEFGSSSFHEIQ